LIVDDAEAKKTSDILGWPVYFYDEFTAQFRHRLIEYISACGDSRMSCLDIADALYAQGAQRMMDDGLHPNDYGHGIIYQQVVQALNL